MEVQTIEKCPVSYQDGVSRQKSPVTEQTAETASSHPIVKIETDSLNSNSGGKSEQELQKDQEKFKTAINELNQKLKGTKTKCEYSFYEDLNRVAIKVIDQETKEVVREIPPEKALDMLEKRWEIAGLLVDEKR